MRAAQHYLANKHMQHNLLHSGDSKHGVGADLVGAGRILPEPCPVCRLLAVTVVRLAAVLHETVTLEDRGPERPSKLATQTSQRHDKADVVDDTRLGVVQAHAMTDDPNHVALAIHLVRAGSAIISSRRHKGSCIPATVIPHPYSECMQYPGVHQDTAQLCVSTL